MIQRIDALALSVLELHGVPRGEVMKFLREHDIRPDNIAFVDFERGERKATLHRYAVDDEGLKYAAAGKDEAAMEVPFEFTLFREPPWPADLCVLDAELPHLSTCELGPNHEGMCSP